MKRLAALVLAPLVMVAAPALAQSPRDTEIRTMFNGYVAAFNKGDSAAIADLYLFPSDAAKDQFKGQLDKEFARLRKEEFGRMDVYNMKVCDDGQDVVAGLGYALSYTFGGVMPSGDEVTLFKLRKYEGNWRILTTASLKKTDAFQCRNENSPVVSPAN